MTDTETPDAATEPEVFPGSVALAFVHSEDVSYSWHYSIIQLIGHDMANEGRIVRGGFIGIHCGTDGLVASRNMAVKQFLDGPAEWLFWVDTDMGFDPTTVDRLLAAADPDHRPIVGALAFSQRQYDQDGNGGWRTRATPTVFDWEHVGDKSGFSVRWDYSRNTVTRVSGTGSACILIHRNAFAEIAAKFGPLWYDRIPHEGQMVSEDLSFCMRAGSLAIPVHVHTGVQASHHKPTWINEDDYLRQRAVDAEIEERAAPAGSPTCSHGYGVSLARPGEHPDGRPCADAVVQA